MRKSHLKKELKRNSKGTQKEQNVNETIQMSKNLFAFCGIHFTLEILWMPFNNNPENDIILQ